MLHTGQDEETELYLKELIGTRARPRDLHALAHGEPLSLSEAFAKTTDAKVAA